MSAYQHSETFATLKNTKEVITQNYTTYQYLSTLDHFLDQAISPLLTAFPSLVDVYFAKVVAWQAHRPSVKFSMSDKHTLPVFLFNALTTKGKTKREHQKKMMLNRGLLFGLLSVFAKTVKTYKKLHDPALRIRRTQRATLLRLAEQRAGSQYLWASITESEYWATKAYKFKELIIQKYTRMAIMNAKNAYEDVNCDVKLDDVIQIFLLYLSKAIDRCDSRQGVLTTFIQTWFYSAKDTVVKSAAIERQSSSYDDIVESADHSTEPSKDFETMQHLCHEARKLDPSGVMRFALNIPEYFSSRDLRKLSFFTLEN